MMKLTGRTFGGVWMAAAGVAVLGGVCWWLTVVMAGDFYRGGGGDEWRQASFGALFLMWAVMMAAMMTPSFAPAMFLFARFAARQRQRAAVKLLAFVGGYLLVWTLFSAGAALLQYQAQAAKQMGGGMFLQSDLQRAALFFVAGMFQFSRLKLKCLRGCRHPALFFVLHWRNGITGAFNMGAHNGVLCAGCCWLLMLLLFAGGVMDLRWIAALALWALAEKTLPFDARKTAAVAGAALMVCGVWIVAL